jgi:hypothetical protein
LSGGKTVTFKKVSEVFHLRNFSNISADERIFLFSVYLDGFKEAEHLATTLHWKCQRPLRALGAMMYRCGKSYTKRGAKHKPLSGAKVSSRKRS